MKSVYSAILLSLFTDLLQQGFNMDQLIPNLIEKSGSSSIEITLLSAFYGGLITGFGMGLVIWKGSTTGGTDIIAMILNKVFSISVGTGL